MRGSSLVEILVPPLVTPLCARTGRSSPPPERKALWNDALDLGRSARYAPAVDRRVVRFNNDLQEPVSRKVTSAEKKREMREKKRGGSIESDLTQANLYIGVDLFRIIHSGGSGALFSLLS